MPRGDLFILSAPSGAGKTTLIRALRDALAGAAGPVFSVSHTTRRCRRGEVDGRDYHFVDEPTFRRMVDDGRFLEWAVVHGHLYGTAVEEVEPRLAAGTDVILDIDVQGAARVRERCPEAVSVLLLPPSYAALAERLRARGLDDPGEVEHRLAAAVGEISSYPAYRYVIVNDDVERASRALAGVILSARHRVDRMADRVERILTDFHDACRGAAAPGAGR